MTHLERRGSFVSVKQSYSAEILPVLRLDTDLNQITFVEHAVVFTNKSANGNKNQ